MKLVARTAGFAALLTLGACQPDQGPLMKPGQDCLRCHGGSAVENESSDEGSADERSGDARTWEAAGTIYADPQAAASAGVKDAEILIVDSTGRALTLHSNSVGNFYTAETLHPPLTVQAQRNGVRMAMNMPAPDGACNRCHRQPPEDGAPGRLFVP